MLEEKKGLDLQRKEVEAMKMEAQVKSALSDLQAFQLKKQLRLNERAGPGGGAEPPPAAPLPARRGPPSLHCALPGVPSLQPLQAE